MKGLPPRSRVLRAISPEPLAASPSPQRHGSSRKLRSENVDPNTIVETPKPPLPKSRSPLPPRPPQGSNSLKRKLSMEALPEDRVPPSSDSGVKVVIRMRPVKDDEGDELVQKISANSIQILDHVFTFDSVADTNSTQEVVFEVVGVPLVENCLAGFNSSIFAYGQTGSGKTYTMWGPTSVLVDEEASNDQRGLTPRVFERLFSRINEEQAKHADKELTYQCRCSFLEIYNEQITDLLDSNHKNLQIREDVKSGVYVEDLMEEYVYDLKDVTKLLIKGLTNRRTGATSTNADSSRSHSVFTCVVESRCKDMADGVSSLKISRINLVDLAGSERQKLTGAAGERLKEAGNINRSLSQLGNLINILAEVSHSGKQRHIPYRDSKLTFLLQESLGGNAKLAMICAISPAQSCKSETFSTLRFAQRAKAIKNNAVVNELRQEDVNALREVIRQLRDELVRLKSSGRTLEHNGNSSTGWNARRSLSLLKKSLSHPIAMAIVDDDSDEEMEIDEEAVENLCVQVGLEPPSLQDPHIIFSEQRNGGNISESEEADVNMEDFQEELPITNQLNMPVVASCSQEGSNTTNVSLSSENTIPNIEVQEGAVGEKVARLNNEKLFTEDFTQDLNSENKSSTNSLNLSIVPCHISSEPDSPIMTISPKVTDGRKSPRISLALSSPRKINSRYGSEVNSPRINVDGCSPTQYLEASLNRGLALLDSHCQNSALRRSSFRFTPIEIKPLFTREKADAGVQTVWETAESEGGQLPFVCSRCQSEVSEHGHNQETYNGDELSLVPVDDYHLSSSLVTTNGSHGTEKIIKHIPKAVEKVLAGSIRREMALEEICAKQTTEITQLNRLMQQYKHERECNAIIEQTREDKIRCLEGLIDGVLPSEDFMEDEFLSLTNEHKLLKEKYEYHPEVLRLNIELKRLQNDLDKYKNFFDMGEKDVLLEEIRDLRSQLQFYVDSSANNRSPHHENVMLHLTYPCQVDSATTNSHLRESATEQLEYERHQWTEKESEWISRTEELRAELEASRSLAEKLKNELDAEKECVEVAIQGNTRILEQYAELHDNHIALLDRHRKVQEGIADVKKAAARAGVKGAESKFIDSLASEISILKIEREKERRYWRDENKGLQQQVRDTAEALQAAGELFVRLEETSKAAAIANNRAIGAEKEAEKTKKEIDEMQKNHKKEIDMLNQLLSESRLPKEAIRTSPFNETEDTTAKYGGNSVTDQQWREEFEPFCNEGNSVTDQRWREEFEPFCNEGNSVMDQRWREEFEPSPSSWFSSYDQCNL